MEHIPKNQLKSLVENVYRKIPTGAYFANLIDYSDHFSNITDSITEYNFYKYSKFFWSFLNPALHFQNRLRHVDYINILTDAGFQIVGEKRLYPKNPKEEISKVKLASCFKHYKQDDLETSAAYIIARKI